MPVMVTHEFSQYRIAHDGGEWITVRSHENGLLTVLPRYSEDFEKAQEPARAFYFQRSDPARIRRIAELLIEASNRLARCHGDCCP